MIDDPYFFRPPYLEIQEQLDRLKEMHTQYRGITDHFQEAARIQSELRIYP
jgi:hypothetical protein